MCSIRRTDAGLAKRLRASLLLGALVGAGCPSPPQGPRWQGAGSPTPRRGGTLVFHHESDVRGFDPHTSFDELSNMGIKLLFEGLLDYDADGHLVPRLAEAMPEVSDDGLTYTFRLREGIRFASGRPVTAEDVRWSLERMLHPRVGSPGLTFYTNLEGLDAYRDGRAQHIAGIRVIDERTVAFRLRAPDQTFLYAMAMTFANVVPRENVERWGAEVARHPVGTGPYVLESWEPGVRVVFRRNEHYWRPGRPYPDRQIFELNLSREPAFLRFLNGELDIIHRQSPADYLYLKRSPAWRPYWVQRPSIDLWGYAMNCELPPFDNVHVRRAVAHAIDRQRWARTRLYRIRPTGQPLPPGLLGYRPDLPHTQRFDLEIARREMALAGYTLRDPDGDGIPEPVLTVEMWIGEGPTGQVYGELVQSDLRRIGITVQLKPVSFPVYLRESGKPRTVQSLMTGWSQDFPDPADFLDILFHSRAIHDHDSENRAFYRNPELDALLDEARVERDRERRGRLYERAASIVARDAPWAFTFNSMKLDAWQPYVRDYRPHPVWDNYYAELWLDLPRRRIARQVGGGGTALAWLGWPWSLP
ncbi:MAG: ABC transporter substrate-binding protein [Myxococcota bacterium]|nr:ABC transporter substrate-binding protein [Myxococcota bacterium]MDW8360993.1 ABC transporter substrate-binding protein [Myxococcales bacterium]